MIVGVGTAFLRVPPCTTPLATYHLIALNHAAGWQQAAAK